VVVVEEVEVAEDLPPHVIPGMIFVIYHMQGFKVLCFGTCFIYQFDITEFHLQGFCYC
jgi:hypothetical protein